MCNMLVILHDSRFMNDHEIDILCGCIFLIMACFLAGFTAQERETLTALHLRMLDNLTPGDSPAGDPFERLGCNCSRP